MPLQPARRRSLLTVCLAITVIVSVSAALIGISNDRYSHDRRAMHAFFTWKESPTAENERLWQHARDEALARDMKFKAVCFSLAALSAATAWHLRRRLEVAPTKGA